MALLHLDSPPPPLRAKSLSTPRAAPLDARAMGHGAEVPGTGWPVGGGLGARLGVVGVVAQGAARPARPRADSDTL